MYLTAHRVQSPQSGRRGINAARYHHSDPLLASATAADLDEIVSTNLGELIRARTDLPPGGNHVEAYLDVVCPDAFAAEALSAVLMKAGRSVVGTQLTFSDAAVTLRFSCNLGLSSDAPELYRELAVAILALFDSRPDVALHELVVHVSNDEGVWKFNLDEAGRERFLLAHPDTALARSISIPNDVADELRRNYGRLYPLVLEWLTAKPLAELSEFDFSFRDGRKLLWKSRR